MANYIKTMKNKLSESIVNMPENFASVSNSIITNNIINDLYQYYYYNGFQNIITEKLIHLLISYSLIFIINLMVNCVNYSALINIDNGSQDTSTIYKYIDMSKWFPNNPYLIICFIIYCVYLFCITLKCISSIRKFWKIKKIYNQYLKINDTKLKFISWDDIVNNIISRFKPNEMLNTNSINIYTINNKICHQANILVSLFRSNYITLPRFSKFLEWNFIYCIVDPMITIRELTPDTNNQNANNSILEYIAEESDTLSNQSIYKKYNSPSNTDLHGDINEPLLQSMSSDEIRIITNQLENELPRDIYNTQTNPYNLDDISFKSSSTPDSSHGRDHLCTSDSNEFTSRSINNVKTINKFDEMLYNTLISQSVCNLEVTKYNNYIEKVLYRINLVMFINIVCLPFTIVIVLVYFIIKYGEKMYSNSSILFDRQINITTLWKLRYYNELPDLFNDRLRRIQRNLNKITKSYKSVFAQIIYRFLIFMLGSIFIILLTLSFIANSKFAELNIIGEHNVIWFLGISGTMLILLNKTSGMENDKLLRTEKLDAFDELKEDLVSIYPDVSKNDDREYLVSLVNEIYEYKMYSIYTELFALIKSPYYLWKWKKEIIANCIPILDIIENHYILGNVSRHSIFTNASEMNNNPHMILSFKEFKKNHAWDLPAMFCD